MINIYYTNNNNYKKLFFLFCTVIAFTAHNRSNALWVDQIAEPHILHENYPGWPIISKKRAASISVLFSIAVASGLKVVQIFDDYLEKNESISWKKAAFFSCCCMGCDFIIGSLIGSIKRKRKSMQDGKGHVYNATTQMRAKNHHFATALILHNKDIAKKKNSWQKISLRGLVQLESIASQTYENRLTKFQKKCPRILSWLIPPQKFETAASFTCNNHDFPLRKPVQENWFKEKLRMLLSPHFPKRSLSLQKKIQTLETIQLLQNRLNNNPTVENIGNLEKLPNELVEYIFSFVSRKEIDITNEEFFVHLLPYITIRDTGNRLITDDIYINDVKLPLDTKHLIKKFYEINLLFHNGIYTRAQQTLVLANKMVKQFKGKNITRKKFIKKLAKTLNLPKSNITIEPLHRNGYHQFLVI